MPILRWCILLVVGAFVLSEFPARQQAHSSEKVTEEPKTPRLDCWGDPLPHGAIARLGSLRTHYLDRIGKLAFSPDGEILAGATSDGWISLWRSPDGKELAKFHAHGEKIESLQFCEGGRVLASLDKDRVFILRETSTRKVLVRKQFPDQPFAVAPEAMIYALADQDGRSIAIKEIGSDKLVGKVPDVLDPEAEKEVRLAFQEGSLLPDWRSHSLQFLGGGKFLQTGTRTVDERDFHIRYWEVASGKEARALPIEGQVAHFSADGRFFVTTPDQRTFRVYQTSPWKELCQLRPEGHASHRLWKVVFGKDGKEIVTLTSVPAQPFGTVQRWEAATGKLLEKLDLAPDEFRAYCSCEIAADARTMARAHRYKGEGYSVLEFWDLRSGKVIETLRGSDWSKEPVHEEHTSSLAFSPDGKVVATRDCRDTRLWDRVTGKMLFRFPGYGYGLAFTGDGKVLATPSDTEVHLLDVDTGKRLHSLAAHHNPISDIVLGPDARTLATVDGGCHPPDEEKPVLICLWDSRTGKQLVNINLGPAYLPAQSLSFSPNGRLLASICYQKIRVWDVVTGKEIRLGLEEGEAKFLGFSADGNNVKIRDAKGDHLLDVHTGKRLPTTRSLIFPSQLIRRERIGLSVTGTGTISCWEMSSQKKLGEFGLKSDGTSMLALSCDQRLLASGGNGVVLVWDLESIFQQWFGLPLKDPTEAELKRKWADLISDDPVVACKAISALSGSDPKVVAFLRERLRPAVEEQLNKQIDELVRQLDDIDFRVREKASSDLKRIGRTAFPLLRIAVRTTSSTEVRGRANEILGNDTSPALAGEQLRTVRAIEVLEKIGTEEAAEILGALAKGFPWAPETEHAKAALDRLSRDK